MTDDVVVRNADWLVAYDSARAGHVYLRNADLAFAGNTITYVGPRYEGEAAREIDARERLVMPGLVNVHSHPSSEPLRKGITDETLSPGFHARSRPGPLDGARPGPRLGGTAPMVLETVDDVAHSLDGHGER